MTKPKDEEIKDCAFMAHIPKENWKEISTIVDKKFHFRNYLIVGESKPYEHLHFYIQLTDREYRNFANQFFRQKYNLRGRASKGLSRQYGKVKKNIRDLDLLLAYMLKDGIEYMVNVFTNMDKKKLQHLYKTLSHQKEEKPYLKFINYLKTKDSPPTHVSLYDLASIWLEICKTRLPQMKTIWYYAYRAEIITQCDYIDICYNTDTANYQKYNWKT